MPVFKKDNLTVLFVHIPKSAGTAISRSFENSGYSLSYKDPGISNDSLNFLRKCSPQHMDAVQLSSIFEIEKFTLVFMVVRNPLDRLKSEYAMRHPKNADISSNAFHLWVKKIFSAYGRNSYILDNHIKPQVEFLIPGVRILKFEEDIPRAMNLLSEEFKLDIAMSNSKVMDRKVQSGFSSSAIEVSDKTLLLIKEFYKKDIEYFGYQL